MYSRECCVLVTTEVNAFFLTGCRNTKGYKVGVSSRSSKRRGERFNSRISVNGKCKHIGTYSTEEEAYLQWLNMKISLCLELSSRQSTEVSSYVIQYMKGFVIETGYKYQDKIRPDLVQKIEGFLKG